MTPPTASNIDTPEVMLGENDVRSIVRLLGEVVGAEGGHAGMKRFLMNGLVRLIDADAWLWTLGCEVQPGEQPIYLSMLHGGFSEERYSLLLQAAAHPDMAQLSASMILESLTKRAQVTRRLQQLVDENELAVTGVGDRLHAADIGPLILGLRPIGDRSMSAMGIYRRLDQPKFTEREARIAHIVLSEVAWLHEEGWPAHRSSTLPFLPPRLRLVLNLLLDGRSRKDIALTLGLSENTVAGYQKEVYSYFRVGTHVALMRHFQLGDGGDR